MVNNTNCHGARCKVRASLVQCDITAALIHGRVPPDEEIYVHQPRSFKRGNGTEVLCLQRTLYGLCQSPRYFYKYFTERLVKQGLTPSNFDPCLFLSSSLIVIIYVNNILNGLWLVNRHTQKYQPVKHHTRQYIPVSCFNQKSPLLFFVAL